MNRVWKVVIVLGMALSAAGRAEAQDWGVKGGVNLSDVKWGDDFILDTKMAIGALGGAFMRFQPIKALPLQVEALVTQVVVDFSSEGADLRHTLTNLQVPVLVGYTVFSGTSVRVRAKGGAAVDIVLFARDNVNGETSDMREAVEPWGASLLGAAEVEWNRWVFDVRYVFGLTNLYQVIDQESPVNLDARQRAVQITAGFRF